jgi:glycosyltransferase 2 family protein
MRSRLERAARRLLGPTAFTFLVARMPGLTRAGVRLLGPVLLALMIARMHNRGEILRTIYQADPLPLVLAVLLNLLNVHLKVVRWQVLLRTRDIHYPLRRAWPAFLSSLYLGMLTPGRVGDLLRAQYLHCDLELPYSEGLASVVMDRLCDLYVLAVFVVFGALRFSSVVTGRLAGATWLLVAITVVPPLALLIPGIAERLANRVYARLAHGDTTGLSRFLDALRANVGPPLARTLPLTVATFLVTYTQGWLIGRALGFSISFVDASCFLAVANLLSLLPITISGIGVREVYFSRLFPWLGHTKAAGITFGLLVFLVTNLVFVALGFIVWQIAPPPVPGTPEPAKAGA